MTVLVVFAGLPGVGEVRAGRGVADAIGATYLRIDSIEVVATRTLEGRRCYNQYTGCRLAGCPPQRPEGRGCDNQDIRVSTLPQSRHGLIICAGAGSGLVVAVRLVGRVGIAGQLVSHTNRAGLSIIAAVLAGAVSAYEALIGYPQLKKLFGDAALNLEEAKIDWDAGDVVTGMRKVEKIFQLKTVSGASYSPRVRRSSRRRRGK